MRSMPLVAVLALAPVGLAQRDLDPAPRGPFGSPSRPRCLTPERDPNFLGHFPGNDCSASSTTISSAYDPTFIYEIPVVVHVIQNTSGTGFISASRVQGQIDVLNEDFRALAGSNGAAGTDAMIQFVLASTDPGGNATNGITYSTNNTWFADGGGYYDALNWDPNRYLNIYTNNVNALGYVPYLPQTGPAGSSSDRVVIFYAAFGRPGTYGWPYDLGRTATHELGHYLGLYHTFDGGCGTSACYTTGDLICDTEPESGPEWACSAGSSSCSSPDPIRNYLNYSYDSCMEEFTVEQVNRIRCTLEFYRPNVATIVGSVAYCTAGTTANGCNAQISTAGAPSGSAGSGFDITVARVEGNRAGIIFYGISGRIAIPWGAGSSYMCVAAPTQRTPLRYSGGTAGLCDGAMTIDWNVYIAGKPNALGNPFGGGEQVYVQGWFRDPLSPMTTSLSNGLEFTVQP